MNQKITFSWYRCRKRNDIPLHHKDKKLDNKTNLEFFNQTLQPLNLKKITMI